MTAVYPTSDGYGYTYKDLARKWGVSVRTVRNWIKRSIKSVPSFKPTKRTVRFSIEGIQEFERANTVVTVARTTLKGAVKKRP